MVGDILGNRYELLEKIGGGGMADVYKAKCRLLNRNVAIKILKKDFVNDQEFVKRFKIEAQSAASLSHPNVVPVFDVGNEGDIYYIVMELVSGITLKEYFERKININWKEAVNISIQICSALEHAHKNHIVHRDIKPHNIMFTSDGTAKVTDFGIARAINSSTINLSNAIMGSVHYLSPEQARGGYTDEKSDIYSMGIVLYEMVTGKVPFDGDSPVSVALKHIQDVPEQPIMVRNEIPAGINNIIMNAIEKNTARRYQTITEMLLDLYRILKDPSEEFKVNIQNEDLETTKKMSPIVQGKDLKLINKRVGNTEDLEEKDGKTFSNKKEKLSTWMTIVASLVVVTVFGFLFFTLIIPTIFASKGEFVIDNYVGKNINVVAEGLKSQNIIVNQNRKFDDRIPKDIIISQNKAKGEKIKIEGFYGDLEFDVSDGPVVIKIPDVSSLEYREAEAKIDELGLTPKIVEEYSDSIAKGYATRTEPMFNSEAKPGDIITVFKSKGPELKEVFIPNLAGKTRIEAMKAIAEAKLTVGVIYPVNSSNIIDEIIKQDPEFDVSKKIIEGTPINLYFKIREQVSSLGYVNETFNLPNGNLYNDIMQVRIEAILSDSNKMLLLINETKNKSDFPFTIAVPVPTNGSSKVRFYIENNLISEFDEQNSGR